MVHRYPLIRKPVLTIFYQYDPWNPTIGGIQSLISTFIKYASPDLKLRIVGIDSFPDPSCSEFQCGKWNEATLHGKELLFLPLFHLADDDVRHLVPTSVRYTLAMMGQQLSSDYMHFHRIEPAFAAKSWSGHKTLFVHNDLQQQINSKSVTNAILWKRFPWIYKLLERSLIDQFSQVLSCSLDSTQLYLRRYPALTDHVRSIKNFVDQVAFYSLDASQRHQQSVELARKIGLAENTQFILFAGRLHPQKDPLLLVNAIAALNDPHVHLLIAGEGELKAEVQVEIKRLRLTDQISLLGAVRQPDLVELYQLSQAFVLTSCYEGFPISVLEALACGTPVVSFACGEIPVVLTSESGVLYQQRSPEAVAASIRHVLSYPERFPAQACVQAAKPYSAQVVTGEICSEMLSAWERRFSLAAAV